DVSGEDVERVKVDGFQCGRAEVLRWPEPKVNGALGGAGRGAVGLINEGGNRGNGLDRGVGAGHRIRVPLMGWVVADKRHKRHKINKGSSSVPFCVFCVFWAVGMARGGGRCRAPTGGLARR